MAAVSSYPPSLGSTEPFFDPVLMSWIAKYMNSRKDTSDAPLMRPIQPPIFANKDSLLALKSSTCIQISTMPYIESLSSSHDTLL